MTDAPVFNTDRCYADSLRKSADTPRCQVEGCGDLYNTSQCRLNPRFASAGICGTYEGRSTFTEAFRRPRCRNVEILESFTRSLNLVVPSWAEVG